MNALDMLRSDHNRLRQLLPKLHDTSSLGEERRRLLQAVEHELRMHAVVEAEIFYPAFKSCARDAGERDLYFDAVEEHHIVDLLLPELSAVDPTADGFRAKAKILHELFEHHASEEEREIFPRAAKALGVDRLHELGRQIMQRKNELEQAGLPAERGRGEGRAPGGGARGEARA